MKSGGMRGDNSSRALITPQLDSIAERSVSFDDDSMTGSDAKDDEDLNGDNYDLEEKAPAPMTVAPDTPEDAMMAQNRPMKTFEDDGDNTKSPIVTTQVTEQAISNRPPLNGDTPAANKVLGQCYEDIKSSDWGELFEPTMIRQAVWSGLSNELAYPVNSTTIEQVAKDTIAVLQTMGLKATEYPSPSTLECWIPAEAGAELWKWKKRLRSAFGKTKFSSRRQKSSSSTGVVTDPAPVPLPQTPKKIEQENLKPATTGGVFSTATRRSSYFQDSHMVTPRSVKRQERVDRAADNSKATGNTRRGTGKSMRRRYQPDDDSSREDEGYDGDRGVQMNEYMRQIRDLTDSEQSNATPRIEEATHRPLGQIKPFSGRINKSENSMQWLRSFIFEMKGTRAPPNEWCMPFELSLRDGSLHWHRQLPKKTKRQWSALSEAFIKYYCSQFNQSAESRYYSAKREDKEHVCDYLNRLNRYARNAGIQFDNGGRKARDHVRRFLETCGGRGLERRLCHVRARDIHELEEMITDILRIEERSSTRDNSHQHSRSRDHPRRREDRHHDDSQDNYYKKDRRDRDNDRRRDDSRNTPRISLAEASITDMLAELHCREGRTTLNEFASARGSDGSDRSSDAGSERSSGDSGRSNEEWDDELSPDESG
ncbi:unnamed protein product [Phytophthora fragariaefolia]|uniref:Unnamed protein product n=1 Tax=Phytophthora fragariaefolia TaxID=1490495 RepID=A0A9W6U7J2_9STRA|nr:unnamed protein product [Phytophthora fragariaefolia]